MCVCMHVCMCAHVCVCMCARTDACLSFCVNVYSPWLIHTKPDHILSSFADSKANVQSWTFTEVPWQDLRRIRIQAPVRSTCNLPWPWKGHDQQCRSKPGAEFSSFGTQHSHEMDVSPLELCYGGHSPLCLGRTGEGWLGKTTWWTRFNRSVVNRSWSFSSSWQRQTCFLCSP